MITILAFIGAISLLVLIHELGHFWVARRCGVKVLRFSLGFGPVIYSKRFANGATEWAISAIPLGGYVKMVDEREGEVAPEDLKYAFNRKPVLQRILIVVAGPLANFLLAIVLYWALFVYGVPGLKPTLGDVPQGSPAAIAQMQPGETITSVNGETIPTWSELRWALLELALRQSETRVEGRGAQGEQLFHTLDLTSLEARDLDGEFLDKLGLRPFQPAILPVIGKVAEGSAAQLAGLLEGDVILRIDDVAMTQWSNVVDAIRAHPEQTVRLEIRRGAKMLNVTLVPQAVTESGKKIGMIGVAPKVDKQLWHEMFTEVSYAPFEALVRSLRKTWETTVVSVKMMGKMIVGEISMKNLSGPITIADYAGQSAALGAAAYFGFLALISISLGVLNLLPIPLLDGGHLLYYVAEIFKGSPVSERTMELGQRLGLTVLLFLMAFALYNDFNRLLAG
jgi:regulator of sigma E protease